MSDTATDLLQGGVAPATGGNLGTSFAEALSQAASKTVNTLQNAEQVSMQALKGDADYPSGGRRRDERAAGASDRRRHPRQGGFRLSRSQSNGHLRSSAMKALSIAPPA